jgi:hypothetical protein
MTLAGFPHSGTPGSTPTCGSPRLFAACRALLRLSVPRHPPCALRSLDRIASGPPIPRTTLGWCSRAFSRRVQHNTQSHDPCFQTTRIEECLTRTSTLEHFRLPKELTRGSRKEVIQPQVPLRLPCYDFAPVTELAFGGSLPCGLGHRLRALPTPMA